MITDDLRQRRLAIIREHMDTEVTKEFDATLATFNGHPHYEIMATGQIFDGDDEVMGYYLTTRTAFPDQRHDNVRFHVADDAVIVEFDLLGTNLGEFYGLPPTGKAFRVPLIAVFFFDGDRIVNERIYFDTASLVTQIGRGELLALAAMSMAESGVGPAMKVHHLNCGTMHMPRPDGLPRAAGRNRQRAGPGRQWLRHTMTAPIPNEWDRLGTWSERSSVTRKPLPTRSNGSASREMTCDTSSSRISTWTTPADSPTSRPRRVHLTAAEALGAIWAPSRREKIRYRSAQWAHDPNIVEHDPHGEKWRGFAAAKELDRDLAGHCARFAARSHPRPRLRGRRCRPSLGAARRRCVLSLRHPRRRTPVPRALTAMESLVAFDRKTVLANHARLAELYQRKDPDLLIVCAHDPTLLEQARATA